MLMVLPAASSSAQTMDDRQTKSGYFGYGVSFGTRSTNLSSDYGHINAVNAVNAGGSAGIVWGVKCLETKLMAGYYHPSGAGSHSIELIDIETDVNFHFLHPLMKRYTAISPYLTVGANRTNYKMYGFYAGKQDAVINYSVSQQPYLGNITSMRATAGLGVAISLSDRFDFVKLFAESKYGLPISSNASADFKNTQVSDLLSFNFGISFGANHFKK